MNKASKCRRTTATFWIIGVAVATSLVGLPFINFKNPIVLSGDHLFILTLAREMIERTFRFDQKLGFPAVHDNLYFPQFDASYRLILWTITRFTSNPFAAVSTLYVIGIAAVYSLTYVAFRTLQSRPCYLRLAAQLLSSRRILPFAYGASWYQPQFHELRKAAEANDFNAIATLGFDGVLVEKNGCTLEYLNSVDQALGSAGGVAVFDDGKRKLVTLKWKEY